MKKEIRNRFFRLSRSLAITTGTVILVATTGCQRPFERVEAERQLMRSFTHYRDLELEGVESSDVTVKPTPSAIESDFTPERLKELEQKAGPKSYGDVPIQVGDDLLGGTVKVAQVSLRDAIHSTVRNNLEVQAVSMNPAIAESAVVAAEARFDGTIVGELGFNKTDEQTPTPIINGFPVGSGRNAADTWRGRLSLRKPLITGGSLEIAGEWNRSKNQNPGLSLDPDPAISSMVEVGINQPLLRNAGSEVNLAEIRVNRNAHRTEIEGYRDALLTTLNQTELSYWQLWQERQTLRVAERLLERGKETADKLISRRDYDALPAEISDAKARVQSRSVLVRRTRDSVVRASDDLKQYMNAPGYPVGSEVMIVPVDVPVTEAITFNYRDAVITALQNRPEIRQALLTIDDTSIREMLADNLRLPRLDVNARIQWNGLDDTSDESIAGLTEEDFVNYIVSAVLEIPIGNREAQANYRSAKLERIQTVVRYEQAVQAIVRQVKDALRSVRLNYELLEPTRSARLAAAENLRTIEVKEQYQAAMTPEFLNLKLQRQETLANAELDEIATIASYQVALSQLYTAMGVSLQRNNIDFVVPEDKDFE